MEAVKFNHGRKKREREEAEAMAASFERHHQQQSSKPQKIKCSNCDRTGHTKEQCYHTGGGMEGIAPWQKKSNKGKAAAAAEEAKLVQPANTSRQVVARSARLAREQPDSSIQVHRSTTTVNSPISSISRLASRIKSRRCPVSSSQRRREPNSSPATMVAPRKASRSRILTICRRAPHPSSPSRVYASMASYSAMPKLITAHSPTQRRGNISSVSLNATALSAVDLEKCAGFRPGAAHAARRRLSRTEAHERLGHIAHSTIETLARNDSALGFEVDLSTPIVDCEVYICAKLKGLLIDKSIATSARRNGAISSHETCGD
jgi:hypothetical protein